MTIEKTKTGKQRWRDEMYGPAVKKHPERKNRFSTLSDEVIEPLYTSDDLEGFDTDRDLGFPGEFPYTRGVQPSMYRGRLWTMRQFAGFGSAEDTNERFRYLLKHGVDGLSVAFAMPTLMGRDSDDPLSRGEVGREGVAVDSLRDMEILFGRIPLDQVTTSMTINGPASIVWAMYLATAEKRGIAFDRLGGTIQNDALKEYIAQREWIVPVKPAMNLVVDTFRYGSREVPRWNTISVSGYHIREAGSTALQELAFTLIDGLEYVKWGVESGLDVNDFVPHLSFFFDVHNDFFEEIAKFRAARRIWAREIERRYHPRNERALLMRTHAQTAGVSLTAQQPYNNVVRVTLQALAAVLGGTPSLHFQQQVDEGEKIVVGINKYATSEGAPIPTLAIDPQVEQKQITRLAETRKTRDRGRWNESIDALRNAAKRGDELMPRFVECARANASVGEQVLVLKEVFGEYHDPGYF